MTREERSGGHVGRAASHCQQLRMGGSPLLSPSEGKRQNCSRLAFCSIPLHPSIENLSMSPRAAEQNNFAVSGPLSVSLFLPLSLYLSLSLRGAHTHTHTPFPFPNGGDWTPVCLPQTSLAGHKGQPRLVPPVSIRELFRPPLSCFLS
jgi:hypothetical protein